MSDWPAIAIEDDLALPPGLDEVFVVRVLEAAQASGGRRLRLSVLLCGDRTMGELHARFLDDPSPTDVLSFPLEPEGEHEADGELVVDVDEARRLAEEHGNAWLAEVALYLVHGVLHLSGCDDHEPEDLAEMKRREADAMRALSLQVAGRHGPDADDDAR
ncbi:MAG: rRNA maturation RNase YbeY [Planctomycetota bacterium]